MPNLPTPHGDKLRALLENEKLPTGDRPRVERAIARYEEWRRQMQAARSAYRKVVTDLAALLDGYKRYVEVDLVFDSDEDFLYRQKGQTKLDNTILEEFLPLLVTTALADSLQRYDLSFGPTTCFSGLRFESSIANDQPGGGMRVREKAHDFAISRSLFIQASHQRDFRERATAETHVAYVVAECKTNLDKTMFQEAAATALDVKTAIDEIIILRKARRLSSNVRAQFNTASGRRCNREVFIQHLEGHPFAPETFLRFLDSIRRLVSDASEDDVLARGYF